MLRNQQQIIRYTGSQFDYSGFHAYAEMSKNLVCFAFIMDSVLVGVIIHYMDLLMECWVHMPQKSPFP